MLTFFYWWSFNIQLVQSLLFGKWKRRKCPISSERQSLWCLWTFKQSFLKLQGQDQCQIGLLCHSWLIHRAETVFFYRSFWFQFHCRQQKFEESLLCFIWISSALSQQYDHFTKKTWSHLKADSTEPTTIFFCLFSRPSSPIHCIVQSFRILVQW